MKNSKHKLDNQESKFFNKSSILIRSKLDKELLDILLLDRTRSDSHSNYNIIWANDNYISEDFDSCMPYSQIYRTSVTGKYNKLVQPRALKSKKAQKERTRNNAEVFTPLWIIKNQNDSIDKNYCNDDLITYIKRKWLEITCGEAPYIVTRYDMFDGKIIPLKKREGFLDRKLRRINKEIDSKKEWESLATQAYKASYGFEWNGDSLFLARENLLYTFADYYYAKWKVDPSKKELKQIAEIISYNIFQMDGLNCSIPLTEQKERPAWEQMGMFPDRLSYITTQHDKGIKVKIMNWDTEKMEFFENGSNR